MNLINIMKLVKNSGNIIKIVYYKGVKYVGHGVQAGS